MDKVVDYINRNFGIRATTEQLEKPLLNKIPLYLKEGFELSGGSIEKRSVLFAKPRIPEDVTPNRLLQQKEQFVKYFDRPVIFVFDQLDSWLRKRLVEKLLGFVQPGKQVFVPELLLELSDLRNSYPAHQETPEHIGFPAQAAILCHLQRTPLNLLSFQQIASTLDYSAMTITRIAREMEQFGLAKIGPGKEKSIVFELPGRELWLKALPVLRSPIRESWYAYAPGGLTSILETGETALSEYSLLAEGGIKQFALGRELFRSYKAVNRLPELNAYQGNIRIEVWQYDPRVVAGPEALAVDKLSLYLSMKENTDERTKDALAEMINGMTW